MTFSKILPGRRTPEGRLLAAAGWFVGVFVLACAVISCGPSGTASDGGSGGSGGGGGK